MQSSYYPIYLKTDEAEYQLMVEFAQTTQEQEYGLMERDTLEEGKGMLFIYEKPVKPFFWMKNTRISLDMIFIGEDFRIKSIVHGAPPCIEKQCVTYTCEEPIQYVLEVIGGYAEKNQIEIGDLLVVPE